MEETAEMSGGEILRESDVWQKLNRALMTCSQGQRLSHQRARVYIRLTFSEMKDAEVGHT